MYKEMEKVNFTMEYCWCLLRHQSKLQQYMMTMNTRRMSQVKLPAIEQSSSIIGNSVAENMEVLVERPLGKKAKKEREWKRKSQNFNDIDIKMALARMKDDRQLCMMERKVAVMKADDSFTKQHELEKKKFEVNIMSLDLVGMNAV